jgi:hypothetical protein
MDKINQIKNKSGNSAIISCYERGFRALEDGTIISAKGKEIGSIGPDNRIRFSYRHPDKNNSNLSVLAHRFIAYQLYGDKIFEPGILVRHLNDNPSDNRFENISLGTKKQNVKDAKKNKIELGNGGKYKGQYGKIYRYYKKKGWSRTMRDMGVSFRMLSYIRKTYNPTLMDKFIIWLTK